MPDLEKKRFSFNDFHKFGVLAIAAGGIIWNQERNTEEVRSDLREYMATQTGIDNVQDLKIKNLEDRTGERRQIASIPDWSKDADKPKQIKIKSE